MPRKRSRSKHPVAEKQFGLGVSVLDFSGPPWKRLPNFAVCPNHSKSSPWIFTCFKMQQPFLELVKEGPLLLLLSIEPQECFLSPGNGPE